METKYYNGTKLLSMKDINGNKPELYMCTSNRSAGKTTFFARYFVKRFICNHEKFCLFYRYDYELYGVCDKFYKEIHRLFFPNFEMTEKIKNKGIYAELFLNGESCGYAIALNKADQIKKLSHLFSDAKRALFDEFQSETNHYCADEITKFLSVHKSLSRGGGEQYKYFPVIMLGNPVTILNPYYTALNISSRLNSSVKFLRGNGYVLEQGYNKSASDATKESGIYKAFEKESYGNYSSEASYLNDNYAFIERPRGINKYLLTLKYKNKLYSIRSYEELGVLYCDDRIDLTYPVKICVTTDDMEINYVVLKNNEGFINNLRFFFNKGCFRFKNLSCKEAIIKTLSY